MADKVKREDLTLHPTVRSHRYFSFTGFDAGFVVVVGAILWIGSEVSPPEVKAWVTVGGGVLFALSLMRSGKFDRRFYQLPAFFVRNYWRRRVQHNRRWTQKTDRTVSFQSAEKASLPKEVILPIRAVRFGDIGTVVNERYGMITFIVGITGTNITTKTISEQKAFNERLAEALKFAVATVRKARPWIGMVYRSRPDNPYEYEKILMDIVDNRILLPESERKPEEQWTEDDYINSVVHQVVVQEGLEQIQSLVDPEMVFTFTVRYSSRFAKILKAAQKAKTDEEAKFEYKHILKEPIMRLRDAVLPLLSDTITGDLKILDFDEMVMYLRKAHDLKISQYYLDAYLAEQRNESMSSTSWMPDGYMDEYSDKLNVNGSWHTTISATSFPDEFAFPFTGRDFYTPRTMHYTAVTIGKITKGDRRYRTRQGASAMSDGAKEFFGIDNRGPKAQRAAQQEYNELAQLDRSGWAATYQPMMTVSKLSEQDLEAATEHVISRLDGSFFEPQRVQGESAQWEAFFTASTGIPLKF